MRKRKVENFKPNIIFLIALCVCFAAIGTVFLLIPGKSEVKALTMPDGYALETDETFGQWNADSNPTNVYKGITESGEKTYYVSGAAGFVTLARTSQLNSFEGCTFKVLGEPNTEIYLSAAENDLNGFFGIGSEEYPFKGTLVRADVSGSIYLKTGDWKFLFNCVSNEAKILPSGENNIIASRNGAFSLCDKLVATKDGESFDISGFVFATRYVTEEETSGAVSHDKTAGLVAARVLPSGSAGKFSIDLTSGFGSSSEYEINVSDGNAGGLFGEIASGADVTVITNSLNMTVSSSNGSAGLIVGKNDGKITVSSPDGGTTDFSGEVNSGSDGSAGGIAGYVGESGEVIFDCSVNVVNAKVYGKNAGGVAGVSSGSITVSDGYEAVVTVGKISCSANGFAGGIAGEASRAPSGNVSVEKGTVTENSASTDGYFSGNGNIGGLFGKFTAKEDTEISGIKITSASFDLSLSDGNYAGGFFGVIEANADIAFIAGGVKEFTFKNSGAGNVGGFAGRVKGFEKGAKRAGAVIRGEDDTDGVLTIKNSVASFAGGGVFGGITADLGGFSYLKADNVSVENVYGAESEFTADFVYNVGENSFADIGNYAYKSNMPSLLVYSVADGGILRLSGNIKDDGSPTLRHIVKRQGLSLVFADGGFKYTYTPNYTSDKNNGADIGNRGQIYRNDNLGIVNFSESDYTVSLSSLAFSGNEIEFASAADAAKYALTVQSQGVFSAVDGIDGTNYSSLLSATINLTADISLKGTGVEQLTDSSLDTPFKGKIKSSGSSVELAIGENISGNPLYKNDKDNERAYIGLFSSGSGATAEGVGVKGYIKFNYTNVNYPVYIGGLFGKTENSSLAIADCSTEVEITLSDGYLRDYKSIYAGGFTGYVSNSEVSVTGSVISPKITHSSGYNSTGTVYIGGAIGRATDIISADFSSDTVKTIINQKVSLTDSQVGGIVSELACKKYTETNFSGTTAEGASVSAISSKYGSAGSTGGLIARYIKNCAITLDSLWQGEVRNNNGSGSASSVGGLIYELEGKLTLEKGFSLGSSSFYSKATTKNGAILANGTNAIVVAACEPDAFGSLNADGFDLFSGYNVSSFASNGIPARGGIVTIETANRETRTDADLGKIPDSSEWFTVAKGRSNPYTRYYFNAEGLEGRNISGVATNAADLVYWSLYNFASDIKEEILDVVYPYSAYSIGTATDNADVTNYCFYPVSAGGVTFKFGNKKLTFGLENENVKSLSQFGGLNVGLFSDITTVSAGNASVKFGDVLFGGKLSDFNDSYSGAFVSGTIKGTYSANATCDLTIENVFFDGLTVEDGDDSSKIRPLLVYSMDSHVSCRIDGVSQYSSESYRAVDKKSAYAEGVKAATSLIGYGGKTDGTTDSTNIYVTISKIVFDGLTSSGNSSGSIFTKSTLFYSINYAQGGGSFMYNFNHIEDWTTSGHVNIVTYGSELVNENQQKYFDKDIYVSPERSDASELYSAFGTKYMPYVFINGEKLSVNHKLYNFTNGYGTYKYPYLISSGAELEFLNNLIKSDAPSLSNDWKINYPKSSGYAKNDYYEYSYNGSELKTDDGKNSLGVSSLQDYLRGAYYKFSSREIDITSSDFIGIGSAMYPFHGVFAGADGGTTVIMPDYVKDDGSNVTENGAGFINTSNGAAVYGLNIRYNIVEISYSKFAGTNKNGIAANETSKTTDTAAKTNNSHFGGVIGWVVGGDNRIDNVSVYFDSSPAAKDRTTSEASLGTYPPVFGGYVGLVSGGGVIISNLGTDFSWYDEDGYKNFEYFNPYIGRLINGYAFSTDKQYENGGKGCDIPYFTDAFSERTGRYSGLTFNFDTAEEFMMFAYGVSSGAFIVKDSCLAYGKNTRPRYGDYSNVGDETFDTDISEGLYKDDSKKYGTSLFSKYFGISDDDYSEKGLNLNFKATEYDLSSYGNAFRGIGSTVNNANSFNINEFKGSVSGNDRTTIKLKTVNRQYYNGGSVYEPDSIKNLGLFLENKNWTKSTMFSDITLSGELSLSFIDKNGTVAEKTLAFSDQAFCGGGFVAFSYNAFFKNLGCENLTVKFPGWTGGIIGSLDGRDRANNAYFTDCYIKDSYIESTHTAGGIIGDYRLSGTNQNNLPVLNNLTAYNTVVRVKSKDDEACAGGIIGKGREEGTNNKLSAYLNGCSVTSSSVLAYSDGTAFAAGLVACIPAVKFVDCTVDGCTIVSRGISPGVTDPALSIKNTASDVSAEVEYLSKGNAKNNSLAGGFIASLYANRSSVVSITTSGKNYVKSSTKATAIIGYTYAGGVIGYSSLDSSKTNTFSISGVSVVAENYPLYVLGGKGSSGIFTTSNSKVADISLGNVKICGKSGYPVYIIAPSSGFSASGLLGVSAAKETISNAEVSGCIIAADYAFGVCSAEYTSAEINNVTVKDNRIQGKYALSAMANAVGDTTAVELYAGGNKIYKAGEDENIGVIANVISSGKSFVGYYILAGGNSVGYGKLKSGFSYKAFFDGTDLDGLFDGGIKASSQGGFVAYKNNGAAEIFAISGTDELSAFGKGVNQTDSLLFAEYGAPEIYAEKYGTADEITIAEAFGKVNFETAEGLVLNGDGVTSVGIDGGKLLTPDYLNAAAKWNDDVKLPDGTNMKVLSDYIEGAENNSSLPVYEITAKPSVSMNAILNLITGGGYKSFDFSVTSKRFNVADNGGLSESDAEGSIRYNTSSGAFVSAGAFDELTTGDKTITLLTITFVVADPDGSGELKYVVDVFVYNRPVLGIKSFVSVAEGETYHINSLVSPPSYYKNVSSGERFTLYLEYAYNEVLDNFDDKNFYFNKILSSVSADGSEQNRQPFGKGTKFILFDLNSDTAYGYKYYDYTLEEDAVNIDLNKFTSGGETGFVPKTFEVISDYKYSAKICDDEGCLATERYVIVVIPTGKEAGKSFLLKGDVGENGKNARSSLTAKNCTVSVWAETSVDINVEHPSSVNTDFSNTEDKKMEADVNVTVSFPGDYVNNIEADKVLYGTHVFGIKDSSKRYVTLPENTVIRLVNADGDVLVTYRINTQTSTVRYTVDDVLIKAKASADKKYTDKFSVIADFSDVDSQTFANCFSSSDKVYYLCDDFYLSDSKNYYTNGTTKSDEFLFTAVRSNEIKVVVTPDNRKYLAVNLNDASDETNSGIIDFTVVADFKGITDVVPADAEISFAIYKKKKNADGSYTYDTSENLEGSFGKVTNKGSGSLDNSLTITDGIASGRYTLTLDLQSAEITNYKLAVTVKSNGGVCENGNYFVFLICRINNDRE